MRDFCARGASGSNWISSAAARAAKAIGKRRGARGPVVAEAIERRVLLSAGTAVMSVSGTAATASGAGIGKITVYLDANNDSQLDNGEQSTVTSASGAYSFPGVPPGSYIVRQILPSGDTQTAPANGYGNHITVASGQVLTGQNFTDTVPATGATISGAVASSGKPLAGETIYLDANNNVKFDPGEPTTTTNASGLYQFTNITPGAYIIRQTLPAGVTQTNPANGLGIHINPTAGGTLTNENFTDSGTPTSGGSATLANGTLTVTGTAGNDTIAVTSSASSCVVTINGTSQSFASSSVTALVINSLGGNDSISAGSGDSMPNATLTAGDGNDTISTQQGDQIRITVGNGNDSISVTGNPQDLSVYDSVPNGVTIAAGSGADTIQGTADDATITVGNGKDVVDFGAQGYVSLVSGNGNDSLSTSGQGDQFINAGTGNDTINMEQDGDNGGGITVTGGVGTDSVTATGIDDNFVLNLGATSGTDTVSLDIEYPSVITTGSGSTVLTITGSSAASVTVNGGAGNDSINVSGVFDSDVIDGGAGINSISAPAGATIRNDVIGTVFYDANNNGTLDSGEGVFPNVQVYDDLSNSGNYVSGDPTTTTNAAGNYTLDLPAGAAIIRSVPPAGYRQDYPAYVAGQHVTIGNNTVTGANFGDTSTTYVGGTVYEDVNKNSQLDSQDIPLSNVVVTLYSGTVRENGTTTASNGTFAFPGLAPGSYTITVTAPPGLTAETPASSSLAFTIATGQSLPSENFAEVPAVAPVQPTPAKLTGTVIGTTGSYNNDGNTGAKAFDGNLSTYFDAPTASGAWTGLDLGTAKVVTAISYAPRSGWASRMVGGVFQGSDSADFSVAVTTLYTVTATPATGVLTTVAVSNTEAFRYVRYLGPTGGYTNLAEAQFAGYAPNAGAMLANGVLTVNGTNNADTISVSSDVAESGDSTNYLDNVTVTVNGTTQTFSSATPISIVVNALGGNDTVTVTSDMDDNVVPPLITIAGGDGNDDITFKPGTFSSPGLGYEASAFIDGGAGADSIGVNEADGSTTIHGGDGNDTIGISGGSDTYGQLYGDEGNDYVYTETDATATIVGGAGNDTLGAAADDEDVISGGDGNDTFQPLYTGDDAVTNVSLSLDGKDDSTLDGGFNTLQLDTDIENIDLSQVQPDNVAINAGAVSGSFTVANADGTVSINAGDGNDTISVSGSSGVTVQVGNGNDVITLANEDAGGDPTPVDVVQAGNGNDTINIEQYGDSVRVTAGNGNDAIVVECDQNVSVSAGNGNDNVFFGTGVGQYELDTDDDPSSATVVTGSGTDTITGFAHQATVTGGAGNDSITVAALQLYVDGGAGNDTISGTTDGGEGSITLLGGAGDDVIRDGYLDDGFPAPLSSINGGDGNDTIYANNGSNDTIDGGTGTDLAYIDIPSSYVKDVVTNVETTYEAPPNVTPLSGTYIGTAGSYNNGGNVGTKALDGILTNYFDAPTASGSYVALDLGSAQQITEISYAPRSGFASRMVGGMFQASNSANFSSGVVTLYTVTAAPASGVLTTANVNVSGTYRYVRYIGPAGSYCDVGEVEFFGPGLA